MPKNILIFADGTGQAGGVRPDQRLSNVYKLYRAARIGPDSPINPLEQIAFYDAGLGSAEVAGSTFLSRVISGVRKFLSSAFGTGFTTNVADCYEYILSVYEPGDRIFLFGFSRGAYTVRSVAGVMNLCGVPRHDAAGSPIPRSGRALRQIVDEAVHTVYEHGAGHPRAKFEDEREEHARRFRVKYRTQDNIDTNVRGDEFPYFIGVFDTVAALGATGVKKVAMIGLAGAVFMTLSLLVSWATTLIFDWSVWKTFLAVLSLSLIVFFIYSYRVRVKVINDFPVIGEKSRHWSGWRFKHYDRFLDKRVPYARHAQAIDETRETFARVGWGRNIDMEGARPEWLVQKWFAGNHSDIGGSYPETESRLSDIALQWMARQAERVPNGIIIDWSKLNLFPDPAGVQHCEVSGVRDRYPTWVPASLRVTWKEVPRPDIRLRDCHWTVLRRMRLPMVSKCGIPQPYRPRLLRNEPKLTTLYPP